MRVELRSWSYHHAGAEWSPMVDHRVELPIDPSVTAVRLSITNDTGVDITALWMECRSLNKRHVFAPPNLRQGCTGAWSVPTPIDEIPEGRSIEWTIAGRVPTMIEGDLPDPTFKIIRMGGGL